MPNKAGPVDRWQRSSFAKVIFISKVSVLSEFIVYLPTAPDNTTLSRTERRVIRKPVNAALETKGKYFGNKSINYSYF